MICQIQKSLIERSLVLSLCYKCTLVRMICMMNPIPLPILPGIIDPKQQRQPGCQRAGNNDGNLRRDKVWRIGLAKRQWANDIA